MEYATCENVHQFHVLFLHGGVPMIFYRVVRPSGKHLGHLCPFVAVGGVRQKEGPLLMGHPLDLEDAGVEVVVPSLPTLFP